jgi:Pvc16 N-terminal domain
MSNALAIAAVTATLRNMLQAAIQSMSPGAQVTVRPLDRARENMSVDSVNLFLYNTGPDAAWRNADLPGVNPGELAQPPLALTLSYLVTSFSQTDDDTVSHRLLGGAMSVLNQAPVLDPTAIKDALPGNDLYLQAERVKVTPEMLDIEEISKLWTAFQTNYRISAAYCVSAVLIQNPVGAAAPLPVLSRGQGDQGPFAQPVAAAPGVLRSAAPADGQLSARLGGVLVLAGDQLSGTSVKAWLTNQRRSLTVTVPVSAADVTDSSVNVSLPSDPATFPAGIWTVQAVISRAGQEDWVTNELPFGLAPTVTNFPLTVTRNNAGTATIMLDCQPQIGPDQDCALLLGPAPVVLAPRTAAQSTVTFTVPHATPDTYPARLRVDGVDSLLVDTTTVPPSYYQSQVVEIR